MSEFKIKVNVELDTNDIESKLNALGKEFDLEVKLDMGKITSQINEIKAAFKDAFKIDSKFSNDLKTIANKLKQVNGSLDDSSSGKNSKSVNSLMQQYKELYKLREKLQKQMASGKLGDDSIERTSEQVAKLTKQISALKNSMSDSQKAGIELFDAKQSTKSLVDMNNYLNKIETQATSLGTKLNSISFNNVDDSKIKSIGERLEEIQRKAREGIDLEFDDVGNILSDLNRISSEIKNLEKVENLASAFEKISSSVAEAGGDVEKFASELKSLEGIASSLDGSFDKAFSNANSELKSMQSNLKNATRDFGDSSNGFLGSWDDFRGNFAQFTLAEIAGDFIADGIRTMARGFKDTIVETDSAIVDLNKVYERGLNGDNLKSYLGTFTEVAKATGKSSVDVIQGTTKAIQSGISDLDQAITYATKASMLSNVGDIEQGQADTMLASIMSAYGGIENSIKPVREQITGMGKDYDTLTKFIDLAKISLVVE